ncbi:MAG: carboxypeptidase regulatory-like domain-containing protein [Bdellovibrionaceae bacterium]|nr:carboxypeptidase regulatory-like domain-containing protein [Pseudobdellovibrionaceae bacterium]
MKRLVLCFLLPAFLFACSEDKPSPKPKDGRLQQSDSALIIVTDSQGRPLANAQVLIGDSLDQPFQGNFLATDAQGQVTVPAAWQNAQAVTAQAPGFVRLTLFGQNPGNLTLRLRDASREPTLELKGATTGHPIRDYDGNIDFGLVISALTRRDLLAFDLNKVISSHSDTMSVVGQRISIPSNVTLPRQKESYIIPVTLEKSSYRLYFGEQGTQRVFAAQGRFPFRTVLSELQKDKQFYELINHFSITGGVVRDISLQGPTRVDLPVNELRFSTQRALLAPALNADQVMIALATAEMNGWLVPTDVKRLASGQQMRLSVLDPASAYAVSVLKNSNEFEGAGMTRLSATIQPFTDGLTPRFLPLIADPHVTANGDLQLSRPAAVEGVAELATHALFSEVKGLPGENGKTVEHLERLWEVFAPEWATDLSLPQWPEGTAQPTKKRWEVTYLGSISQNKVELGQSVIDAATHVTHSSLDF